MMMTVRERERKEEYYYEMVWRNRALLNKICCNVSVWRCVLVIRCKMACLKRAG